ncbi:hypothetical protein AB7M17_003865 [Bradyrhizobium sp. USDA 377]
MIEPRSRGVLDAPPSRGMTAEFGAAAQANRIMPFCPCFARRRKQNISPFQKSEKSNDFGPISTVHGVVFALFVFAPSHADCNSPASRYAPAPDTNPAR